MKWKKKEKNENATVAHVHASLELTKNFAESSRKHFYFGILYTSCDGRPREKKKPAETFCPEILHEKKKVVRIKNALQTKQ